MNILIENTQYSILIYILINKISKDDIYYLEDGLDKKLIEKLKEKVKTVNIFPNYKERKLIKIKYILRNFRVMYNLSKKNTIFGNDSIIFSFIFRLKNFILIEDGTINYKPTPKKYIKNILSLSPLSYRTYGYSKHIKKIYLTGLATIPKEIIHKVEVVNLKELWSKKTLSEKNEILDIFSLDLDIKRKINGKDIILFTQSLSEDNIITEKEKIEIYLKIIKEYPKDRLVIKTHPREKTNYKEIFKGYLILDSLFPFEILSLLDIKFSKAVTIFSTAALGLGNNVEVDFYGTEIHEKILEKFGSYKQIYPTTKKYKKEE